MLKRAAVFLSAILVVSFCAASTGFRANAVSSEENWSMFHHDPAHTGYTNSTGPTSAPGVLWKSETYGPVSSSPAVVDGIVYVSAWFLHAFYASTGSEIWNVSGGGQLSSPIVIDGYVYTGNNGSTV